MLMPTVATDLETFRATAQRTPANARIPVEVRVRADPFEAYRRVRDSSPSAYLETGGGQPGWGYFAVDPFDYFRVDPDDDSALSALAARLGGESLVRSGCNVPYPCGAIGWLSYDIVRELEELPDSAIADRDLPRLELALYDCIVAWKEPHEGETLLHVTACPVINDDPEHAYERGYKHALALADAAMTSSASSPSNATPAIQANKARFEPDCSRGRFADRVQHIQKYINDGDTFQTNISQRLRASAAVHPLVVFAALREVNPAPYSALVEFPSCDLVSASPELLFDREGSNLVTEPIAGTRPRGDTPTEDAVLERELLSDEKERAEHAMLVDLERNDLGKVSVYGSVTVPEYRRVDRYSEVMHLVSRVTGQLRSDCDLTDVIAAVFPGGTITGAPKPRTMELIDEIEATRRGPYTGTIGIFGFDGNATLNIVIRTLVRYGAEYHLRVGAGIVHDSVPDHEYDETLAKGKALITAINNALEDETRLIIEGY
jgi:anthranilate synthase component 1